jgi:translocator protein
MYQGLFAWLLVSVAAAVLGGLASTNAPEFYAQLNRPGWAPPASLFGPVWTVLYLMMGAAAWMVWKERGWNRARNALVLYMVQLALNALWTWIFFVWHMGAAALIEILVLWVLIGCTVVAFWRVRAPAGALLVPYWIWVSFASVLTYAMWQGNPQIMGGTW